MVSRLILFFFKRRFNSHLSNAAEDTSRPPTPAPKPAKDSPAPPAPPASRGAQRGRGGPASRGGKYYQRGGRSGPKESPSANPPEESTPPIEGAKKKC